MISLEQIRNLENKVQAAVTRIKSLADERAGLEAENETLKERLESYEERISELQTLVSAFKADQDEIEAGIMAALSHLDELEDTVSEPPAAAPDGDARARTLASPVRSNDQTQPTGAGADTVDAPGPDDDAVAAQAVPADDDPTESADAPGAEESTTTDESARSDEAPDGDAEEEDDEEDEEPELDIF